MNSAHTTCTRLALIAVTMLAGPAVMAGTLHLPPMSVDNTLVRDYHCQGGTSLHVTYYNQQGGQSFALITVKDKPMLFVDTIAASGVRYVAGPYVWWTKGENGDLYDVTAGPNAAPIIAGCTSASRQP